MQCTWKGQSARPCVAACRTSFFAEYGGQLLPIAGLVLLRVLVGLLDTLARKLGWTKRDPMQVST